MSVRRRPVRAKTWKCTVGALVPAAMVSTAATASSPVTVLSDRIRDLWLPDPSYPQLYHARSKEGPQRERAGGPRAFTFSGSGHRAGSAHKMSPLLGSLESGVTCVDDVTPVVLRYP